MIFIGGRRSTSETYNSTGFLSFTDPYGRGGSAVHPDVYDFGTGGWRGHRFWMVCTPNYSNNYRTENPSIYYADTATAWVEATSNPIYPPPTNTAQWNSDTDLEYDPTSDELVLIFRGGDFAPRISRSGDGAAWSASPTVFAWPGVTEEIVSPSLLRTADGTWHAWGIAHPSRIMYHWTAAAPEGPWSLPVACSGWNTDIWHFNVVEHAGRLLCLMHEGWTTGTAYTASSGNGIAWAKNPSPVLEPNTGGWDTTELYRSALTVHENLSAARVWYSGRGPTSDSWRLGYTEIPLSKWPTAP